MREIINYNIIIATLLFIGFDIFTGVLSSFITGTFESSKMRMGGLHKLFLIVVVAFGVSLDFGQHTVDLGINIPATNSICLYIALMEILSCIENINKAYPNALPKRLIAILNDVARDNEVEVKEGE